MNKIFDILTKISYIMIAIFFILIFLITVIKYNDPYTTKDVLEKNNYTQIKILPHRIFTCNRDDLYSTSFEAYNGKYKITGVVCKNLFGNNTIRFD